MRIGYVSEFQPLRPELLQYLEKWPLFDNAIVEHGFTEYMRDYDVVVDAMAPLPNGSGSYVEGRYRLRFTHCVQACSTSSLSDDTWRVSLEDLFTDYNAWLSAGEPAGYVWGVKSMDAYPGATYIRNSVLAADWSRRLGQSMHEVRIQTNAHNLQLIFHDLKVYRIASGDAATRDLTPIEPQEITNAAA
jgi:hypothetical protein